MSFNSFFTKALKDNEFEELNSLPKNLLSELQKQALSWARKYRRTYGILPTPEVAKTTQFKVFVTESLLTSPIKFLKDKTIEELIDNFSSEAYSKLEIKKLNGQTIQAQDFRRIAAIIDSAKVRRNTSIRNLPKTIFSNMHGMGLRIGVPFIDDTALHFPGHYTIFYAPPGSAKTYLMNYVSAYQLLNARKILVVRGEMSEDEFLARIAGICLKFNSDEALQESNDDWSKAENLDVRTNHLYDFLQSIGGDIIFTENATPTIDEIKYYAETNEVDLVIIDGLYQLKSDRVFDKDMDREGGITNQIRDWCKDGSEIQKFDEDGTLIQEYTYYPRIVASTQMNRVGISAQQVGVEHMGGSIKYAQDASSVYAIKPVSPSEFQVIQTKARRSKRVKGMFSIDWSEMNFSFNGEYSVEIKDAIKELCLFSENNVIEYVKSQKLVKEEEE